jgi:PAS domain S-box-containing protein
VSDKSHPPLDLGRFFELSLDPLCIAEPGGSFVRVNAEFQRMLGYTEQELTSCGYIEFVHPEDRGATRVETERLQQGEPVLSFTNRYRCKDGSWKRLSWRATPPDKDGFIYAIARDLTGEWNENEVRRAVQKRTLSYQETLLQLRDEEHESLEDFLQLITAECARVLETERVSVWLFSDDGDSIVCRDLFRRTPAVHENGIRLERADFPRYFHAVSSYDALVVKDARVDAATREFDKNYLQPNGIASMLDIPIRSGGRLAGVLCCEHTGELREWDTLEEKFATNVAAYLMAAIERAERRAREDEVRELNATLEHRVAERTAELAANERRFRALFSTQFNFIGLLSVDGVVLEINDTALSVGHLTRDDVIGRPLWETHWWDVGEEGKEKLRVAIALAARGGFIRYEFEAKSGNDTRIILDFTITPITDDSGNVTLLIPEGRDITQSKAVESALRESEERFRSAMENSAIGMALVALDGKWLQVNRAISEIVGYTEEELLRLDFQAVTHPGDLDADLEHIARVLSGQIPSYQMEKRYIHKSGAVVWGLLNVSLVRDDAGAPRYFISQVQDITERKKSDDVLRAALDHQRELARRAQAGERARSEFLAMMSHEVRTPMNGILGYSELLAHMSGLPQEGREYAETIVRSGTSLLRILDDILDWSRLDAGRLEIESAPFSPVELLRDIRTLLTPAADAKKLTLNLEVADSAQGLFIGDAGRLSQIVLNLGGNAIKFTESGSVTIGLRAAGADIEFFVRDTGSGIDAALLERMFDPFVQADSSHSRRFGGAGLGLSISRRLAILMGGTLTASSRPGQGSEFVARVPLLPASAGGRILPAQPAFAFDEGFARAHPLSILVVEDDNVNLRLILTMLRKLGYEPLFAKDGAEAVEIVQRARPRCILMDVQMPNMDGIEAVREIRSIEAVRGWNPAFICALTADTLVADRERCLEAGMDEYLNKPLRRDQLARVLESAVDDVAV